VARTPLHETIAVDLRHRIAAREFQAGDLLPSEAELCAEFSVSRSTVRQALATLEAAGLVRKAQGRGSVVAPQAELHRDVARTGLSLQFAEGDASITTEVLEYAVLEAPDSVPVLAGRSALRILRRRATNGEPYAVIRTWMPAEFAAAITSTSLENASLHERFATALQRPVAGGRRQVRAVAATPQVARQLGIAEGDPLLLLEGQSVDREGRLLEVFQTWHRADLVTFDVAATPGPRPPVTEPHPAGASVGLDQRVDAIAAAVKSLQQGLEAIGASLDEVRRDL